MAWAAGVVECPACPKHADWGSGLLCVQAGDLDTLLYHPVLVPAHSVCPLFSL